ncbi:MAG: hypothetical protein U0996_26350 [Planctomycetaceae bacterium]
MTTSNGPLDLILLSKAQTALAEARTVDEVRNVRDKAEALRAYARKARLGRDILVEAAAIKLRAERSLGTLLQNLPLAKSAVRPADTDSEFLQADNHGNDQQPLRLQDLGLTKSDSFRLQRIARVESPLFETYIADSLLQLREPTAAGCLRLLPAPTASTRAREVSTLHMALQHRIEDHQEFTTIYADLPWPMAVNSAGAGRKGLSIDQLCELPIRNLVSDQSHAHILVPHRLLAAGMDVVDAWGFRYRGCLPLPLPARSVGIYGEPDPAFLLTGQRGQLPFLPNPPRGIPAGTDTASIRRLLENISPGPFLELSSQTESINGLWMLQNTGSEL